MEKEGLTKNPLSVPTSASSLNPETQSSSIGGIGYIGCLFTYIIHVNRLYWKPLSLKTYPSDVHANLYPHRDTMGWGAGWMEPLPGVFDMLQYLETILPLVESL